jgi:hypothetical protein
MWQSMPRYFFDLQDDTVLVDDEGTELAGIDAARRQALAVLGGIAKDELARQHHDWFAINVRDQDGRPVLTASLSVRVETSPH